MVGRAVTNRAERRSEGSARLSVFDRIAPAAPIAELVSEIESATRPGEAVADLLGRGGWVGRAAIASQRRVVDLETSSLTRLLAEVVVNPPDERHIQAAAQAISLRPLLDSTVKGALDALFASRCPVCNFAVVLDALVWEVKAEKGSGGIGSAEVPRATRREFRCDSCQRQRGVEFRHAAPVAADLELAAFDGLPEEARDALLSRFPAPAGSELPRQILGLHTARQLVGLNAILEGIELETRSAALTAALRMALLVAVESASRLNVYRGKPPELRIAGGEVHLAGPHSWRERNPWPAFLYGVESVRAFVLRLQADEQRAVAARFAADPLDLQEGTANVVLAESTPAALRRIGLAAERISHSGTPSRVHLVLSQAPLAMTRDRLAEAYHATAWALGAEAAARLPVDELFAAGRAPTQPADRVGHSLARTLAVATPLLAPTGRAVILLDDSEPLPLVAAALGGAAAGWRLAQARLHRGEAGNGAMISLVPPAAATAGQRGRAGRPGQSPEGGWDAATPLRSVFAVAEKPDDEPFRQQAAAAAIGDTAVELIRARGEPAHFDELLGDLLVGLDRSGHLGRLARQMRPSGAEQSWDSWVEAAEPAASVWPASGGSLAEGLLSLVRAELEKPGNRRLRRVGPDQYWLGADEDRSATAQPLADRAEWAIFGLLSSSRRMAENAVFERTEAMFQEHDVPDRALLRACLDSYSAPGSTPEAVFTADQLERRSTEHDEVVATIARLGHRLGMRVWIGRRQQSRRVDGRPLSELLSLEEREIDPTTIAWGPEAELERIDCAWYARHRIAFLFEVEWTAMLSEPVLVRHQRFPGDDNVVRFLAIPPERAALIAHKLGRSPLLRKAVAERNWHFLKWDQLAAFAAHEEVSLAALEPYVGLEADAASSEQLPMFEV